MRAATTSLVWLKIEEVLGKIAKKVFGCALPLCRLIVISGS